VLAIVRIANKTNLLYQELVWRMPSFRPCLRMELIHTAGAPTNGDRGRLTWSTGHRALPRVDSKRLSTSSFLAKSTSLLNGSRCHTRQQKDMINYRVNTMSTDHRILSRSVPYKKPFRLSLFAGPLHAQTTLYLTSVPRCFTYC